MKVTPNFIKRLGLETELEGHEGCVNCLEWNESGTLVFHFYVFYFTKKKQILIIYMFSILASASDDMHVILWDPFRYEKKLTLQTGHDGNIFTVKVSFFLLYVKRIR